MIARLVNSLRALLHLPARVDAQFSRLRRELDEEAHDVRKALKTQKERAETARRRQEAQLSALEQELAATRDEMRDRLLQHHLQLGRLHRLIDTGSPAAKTYSNPVPLTLPPAAIEPAAVQIPAGEWLDLERCAGCGTAERTIVCEWNKSILLDGDLSDGSTTYNYALCHGCGIVYATRRPIGVSYRSLMEEFPETIGREAQGSVRDALLNPYPLTDADRQRSRELIAAGVFVSDHEPREHLEGVYRDRLENAAHVEILAGLLDLSGARVLEVRSRAGTIVSGLRRLFGASVMAMPIFESQQLILRELCGIECSDVIDYDQFTVPFEGRFDLIACNHMLTHIVRLDRFFEQMREHLKPGGHLYLYNEVDEDEIFVGGKSLIGVLNAIHLQMFDRASLIRLLNANGFEVVFIKLRNAAQLCLARFTGTAAWTPMPASERSRRGEAYAQARARAILRAPEALRSRFGAVWADTVEQAVAAGVARFDDKGRLQVTKP